MPPKIKFFTDKGVVVAQRQVVAFGTRLAAVELAITLKGLVPAAESQGLTDS